MLPIKLKIENFFSHKQSEIDFNHFNSALLLGNVDGDYTRSNGSGKSAIMQSILWCLYNKSRASSMDDIITWGEQKCSVSLQFSHEGEEYIVKRNRNRTSSTSTVDILKLSKENKWESLSGSTSGETNDRILSLLKVDYKTFINSAYFMQNDISEFATSEASKKKEILKSIVDISKWDSYEKESKKKLKDIQTELIKVQARFDSISKEVEILSLAEKDFQNENIELENLLKEKQILVSKVESLNESYLKLKNNIDTNSWDKATEQITSLKVRGKELRSRYDVVIDSLSKKMGLKNEYTSKILMLENQISSAYYDDSVDEKFLKNSEELAEFSGSYQQSIIKLKELDDINLHNDECYTCHQKVDDETLKRLSTEKENNVIFYTKKKESSEKRIKYLQNIKMELEQQRIINSRIDKAKDSLKMTSNQLLLIEKDILESSKEKDQIYSKMLEVKDSIKNNEDVLLSLKNETFQNLHDDLKESRLNLQKIESIVVEKLIRTGSLSEKIKTLNEKRTELLKIKSEFDKQTEESLIFDKLTKMFGKSGIQTILLDAIISDLESSANKILASICADQFEIRLETQRAGSDGVSVVETLDLNIKKDGMLCGFQSLSGGEQFRIALALRIALSELATKHGGSSLEFLLLDEINSPLDKNGVDTLFVNIIKQLEQKYKILVITHDDSLKERFDNVIDVSKVNGDSFITQTTANIS